MNMSLQDLWLNDEKRSFLAALFLRLRQSQKLYLSDVAMRLRVPEHLIQAIESGQWDQLPPQPYGSGLLRTYARFLQFNLEDAVTNPEQFLEKSNEEEMFLNTLAQEVTEVFSEKEENYEEDKILDELNSLVNFYDQEPSSEDVLVMEPFQRSSSLKPLDYKNVEKNLVKQQPFSPSLSSLSHVNRLALINWSDVTDLGKTFYQNVSLKLTQLNHKKLYGCLSFIFLTLVSGLSVHFFTPKSQEDLVISKNEEVFPAFVPPNEKLSASLIVRKSSQFLIDLDGQLWKQGILQPGLYELEFQDEAKLDIQDGSAAELLWQGWNYGVLGPAGRHRLVYLVRELPREEI